jgi:valyl-tRNA synthetase
MMPFITEELWHEMGYGGAADFIMTAPWPVPLDDAALARWGIDRATVDYVDDKHELIRAGRMLRADYGIAPGKPVAYRVRPHTADAAQRLRQDMDSVRSLLKAESLTIEPDLTPEGPMPGAMTKLGTVYLPLAGLVDVQAETKRLKDQLEDTTSALARAAAKLNNPDFVQKAKPEIIEQQRAKQVELTEKGEKLRRLIEMLAGK